MNPLLTAANTVLITGCSSGYGLATARFSSVFRRGRTQSRWRVKL